MSRKNSTTPTTQKKVSDVKLYYVTRCERGTYQYERDDLVVNSMHKRGYNLHSLIYNEIKGITVYRFVLAQ